jgi:PAS domain S-box-containing protein
MPNFDARMPTDRAALKPALVYAVAAALWIVLSDSAEAWLLTDPEQIRLASLITGWLFVVVTALLLYVSTKRSLDKMLRLFNRLTQADQESRLALQALNEALEAKVNERTRELLDLYDRAPFGYHSLAPDGTVLRVNQTELDLLGYTREEYEGHLISDFMTPEFGARFAERFAATKQRNQIMNAEVDFLTKSGEVVPFMINANVVRDDAGQILYTRSTLVDQRDNKARENQITELNRLLGEVVESLPFALVVLNEERRVILRNQLLGPLLNYPPELAQKEPLFFDDMVRYNFDRGDYPGLTHEQALSGFVNAIVNRQHLKFQRLQANGVHLEVNGIPISGGWSLITYTDITAHKQAEEALELANAVANAASQAKSAFLANMSHEIRTPMNAIIGLTHLMARDTKDALQRERLGKIDGAGKHLLQIINDILDLSKIEAGKLTLEHIEFSRDELLSRAFEMVSDAASEKGLELILDTDHLPDRLTGDPKYLAQALINLLANAVKFTKKGWVRVRGELLAEQGDRLQVRFEVQDTGIGIAQDRRAALFSAFEQADGSTTRRYGGTGLGLALTGHLATLMGGTYGVESEEGVGSTFWFTAWIGRAQDARAAPLPIRGLRALLVDDLPEALSAIADRLTLLGLAVDAELSGEAAVRRVEAQMKAGLPYDVMLIDWRMAPMDGIDTLGELRKLLGAGLPPSVLVTAHNDDTMWRQARQAAFDAVLVKPITPSMLNDSLMRVLRRDGTHQLPPPAPMPEDQAAAQLRRDHFGQRVLLAEDNPINQEVASELLSSVGLTVEIAGDGARAVDLALARDYDLVLMDIQMPEMDGLAATRAIRAKVGRRLPIIAMTANAFSDDRAACLEAGMNDHIAKPVDPPQLYGTLLRWLPLPASGPNPTAAGHGGPVAPAAAVPPLLERLKVVAGLDLAMALHNVGGNPDTLERVMRSFINNYAQGLPGLLAAPDAERLRQWRADCHSLRGACSVLGAHELQGALLEFEHQLDEATDAQTLGDQGRGLQLQIVLLVGQLKGALLLS